MVPHVLRTAEVDRVSSVGPSCCAEEATPTAPHLPPRHPLLYHNGVVKLPPSLDRVLAKIGVRHHSDHWSGTEDR